MSDTKSVTTLWIDRNQAKVLRLGRKSLAPELEELSHSLDRLELQLGPQIAEHRLFAELAAKLDGEEILILGPDVAKYHFFTFLREHRPELARKVRGCETTSDLTNDQVRSFANTFFKLGN